MSLFSTRGHVLKNPQLDSERPPFERFDLEEELLNTFVPEEMAPSEEKSDGVKSEPADERPGTDDFQSAAINMDAFISKEEANRREKEAYQKGFYQGREEGVRLGQEEIKPYVEMIEAIVKEWEERKERFFEENELVVVRLAFEIAKKVVHQEISANPDLILYVVREALKKAAGSQNLTVRLNPQDVAVLEKGKEERLPELKKFERLEIVADEKIERGGCILETDSGLLDAQLAVQLKKIEEALLEGSRE